jgi:lipopolysaccharide transport system ATP-binding protein
MSSEPAIRVETLGKCYQIYAAPHDRLKQSIIPRLQRTAKPFARLFDLTITPRQYCQEFWALRDINLTVAPGETMGIIGPNGSGKSTLLQLIYGTLAPTIGRMQVNGRIAALLELGSGFNPEFTGRENVYLNGTVLGLTREQIDERFDDILAFADIGDFIDQPIKTYSSGMGMRLAFAVVAHVDADMLLIDEALAVGDTYFQQKCLRWLRQFREHGTVLFCSHDAGAVINLCEQAVWLDHGSMRAIGPAKEVCEAYTATIYARTMGLDDSSIKKARSDAPNALYRKRENEPKVPLSQIIEVMELNENSASFGTGDATIVDVRLLDVLERKLGSIQGGEEVQIIVKVHANRCIENPIIGFHIKDRLGQPLFGDNTYLQYRNASLWVEAGQTIEARFIFELPLLQSGSYSVTAAIASGTLESHVQHHWLHDSLIFEVHSPFRNGVMIAIPMRSIKMEARDIVPPGSNSEDLVGGGLQCRLPLRI